MVRQSKSSFWRLLNDGSCLFGKDDSSCCANWALKCTTLDHKDSVRKNANDAVLLKLYMDDYMDSFNNTSEMKMLNTLLMSCTELVR